MARLTFKLAKDYGKAPWTMPLPEFGKHYYNLGRSAAYAAAARGDIPVIRIGGKLLGLPRVAELSLVRPTRLSTHGATSCCRQAGAWKFRQFVRS
jgi:hypothetical protein